MSGSSQAGDDCTSAQVLCPSQVDRPTKTWLSRMWNPRSSSKETSSEDVKPAKKSVKASTRQFDSHIQAIVRQEGKTLAHESKDTYSSAKECLASLYFSQMAWRRDQIHNSAHPNTCLWIQDNNFYKIWKQQDRGLLWIKGKPGAGKSTLMGFIIQEYEEQLETTGVNEEDLVLSFYFHGRGALLQRTPIGMCRSLMHQLVSGDKTARAIFHRAYDVKLASEEIGASWEWQPNELKRLFRAALLATAEIRKLAIFVDALDELRSYDVGSASSSSSVRKGADSKAASEVVEFFHQLDSEANSQARSIKICISSRHYPILTLQTKLQLSVEDHNHDDITLYIQDEVKKYQGMEDHTDPAEWEALKEVLISRSTNVFQWAKLVTPLVLEARQEGQSFDEVFETLRQVPQELGDLYKHILENIVKPDYKRNTLLMMQWICLAHRPLSVTELRYALASSALQNKRPGSTPHNIAQISKMEGFVNSDKGMIKKITSWSGGLAEVTNSNLRNRVQLIHQSVSDFFQDSGFELLASMSSLSLGSSSGDIIGRSHDLLSKSCIDYLSLLKDVDDSKEEDCKTLLPFVEYAILWPKHASQAETRQVPQRGLVDYFDSHHRLLAIWADLHTQGDSWRDLDLGPQAGTTLLHIAAIWNLVTVADALFEKGRDTSANIKDNNDNRPLHFAAWRGHLNMVQILLRHYADVGVSSTKGRTPLGLAVANGHQYIAEYLIRQGADVNDQTGRSGNALQIAVTKGDMSMIEVLLHNGAYMDTNQGFSGSALKVAARTNNLRATRLLLKRGANVDMAGGIHGFPLNAACWAANLELVKLLLDSGAEVDAVGGSGYEMTALEVACKRGSTAMVDLLLKYGANVNFGPIGRYGYSIIEAAYHGRAQVVKLLIKNGADIDACSGDEGTALMCASAAGHFSTVELLLRYGADANLGPVGYNGHSIIGAAKYGHTQIVKLLIENGADVNIHSDSSGSAIVNACQEGHADVVALLLKAGADIKVQNSMRGDALQTAKAAGHEEIVQLLLDHISQNE